VTELLFLVSLVLIWVSVLHALSLALAGAVLSRGPRARPRWPSAPEGEWPSVTLLVPAHDEALVIERSLERYLALDYPRDRLRVVVVDDGSTDGTGELCDRVAARDARLTVVHVPPGEGGRGKPAALNRALPLCGSELVAVYDADNRPRADALRWLVADWLAGGHAAAIGRIVKVNRRRRLLCRLSSLDFAAFEWSYQAGRARLYDVVLLPGTNYVIDAAVLRALGGWDPAALTEDLELSVRLYCAGHRVSFVPEAVSEEQDPEQLRVWVRQRTRWLLGAYYVLFARTGTILRSRRLRAYVVFWELFHLYGTFLLALAVSQTLFWAGVAGLWRLDTAGPLPALWLAALAVYVATLQVVEALELEDSWRTPLLAVLMYLVYSPLWLFVFARGLWLYLFRRRRVTWAKTPRTSP